MSNALPQLFRLISEIISGLTLVEKYHDPDHRQGGGTLTFLHPSTYQLEDMTVVLMRSMENQTIVQSKLNKFPPT